MADSPTLPLAWLKFQAICVVTASLAVPIVIAIIGNAYTDAQKHSEVSVRYVELATSILKSPPTEENKALRTWAVEVLDATSPVRLTLHVKEELSKDGIQPDRSGLDREAIWELMCQMEWKNSEMTKRPECDRYKRKGK